MAFSSQDAARSEAKTDGRSCVERQSPAMSHHPSITISHVGICTSDLDRSARFYTEALGFALEYYVEVGAPFDSLTELPGIKSRVGFFVQNGLRIELLGYESPAVVGSLERRPMNQVGITHLSLIVKDIRAVTERIVAFGGRVYPKTEVMTPKGRLLFCTDPDGVRIELWQKAE
jgi:predicted enzyme related to lactoylglutathione lyase